MVAVFVGQGTGFVRGSGALLGGAGLLGSGTLGRFGDSVSVNAATGNVIITQQDEFLVGRGLDVAVSRTYNGLGQLSDQDNGDNWQQSTTRRVFDLTGTLNAAGSTISRLGGDGSVVAYSYQTIGGVAAYWTTDGDGAHDRLVKSGATWIWTDGSSQVTETYEATVANPATDWRIREQKDTDGLKVSFVYVASTDKLYRVTTSNHVGAEQSYVEYRWDGSNITEVVTGYTDYGDIGSATDNVNKTQTRTRYAYETYVAGGVTKYRLQTVAVDLTPEDESVADGATFVTTYTYHGDTTRVKSIATSEGGSLSFDYTGGGQVWRIAETVAGGVTRAMTLSYQAGYTNVTLPDGKVTRLDYDGSQRLTKITMPSLQTMEFAYDADGNVASVEDLASQTTNYTYDASGNLLTSSDPNGNGVTRTYGDKNELLSEARTVLDESGTPVSLTTRYAYDVKNHLRYAVSPEGRVREYRYTNFGEIQSVIEYPEHSIGETPVTEADIGLWKASISNLSSVEIIANTYDGRGNIWQSNSYSIAGIDGGASQAQGFNRTYYAYDQWGRLLSRYLYNEQAETFVYDGLDRLVASHNPATGATTIVFDDPALKTTITTSMGGTSVSTYNSAGDLLSVARSGDGYDTNGVTAYRYDKLGRVWMITTPRGVETPALNEDYASFILYDDAGRKTADIASDGSVVEYRYDAAGRLAATIAYATKLPSAKLRGLINAGGTALLTAGYQPASDAADIWNWNIYDVGGRLIQTVEGNGEVIAYTYDKADRLVKTVSYVTKVSVVSLKADLPIVPVVVDTSADDRISRSFYDADGMLVAVLDGEGYLTETVYDKAGRKVEDVAYAAQTNVALRASGSLAALRASAAPLSGANRHLRHVYDGQGLLRYQVDNLGYVTGYEYGLQGRARHTASIAYATPISPGNYSFSTVLASVVAHANDRKSHSVYTAKGQVAYMVDAAGLVTSFSYDGAGRIVKTVTFAALRTSTSVGLAVMDSWASSNAGNGDRVTRSYYSAGGQLRYSVDAEGFVTRLDYDADGNMTAEVRFASAISVTDASTTANVAALAVGASITVWHLYDLNGRRHATIDGEGFQTRRSWDGTGNLVSVIAAFGTADAVETRYTYDGAGRVLTETAAYGTLQASTMHYAYDGLGNRISLTNPIGKVTSWTYDELGRALTMTTAAGTSSYEYNAFGEMVKATDARHKSSYNYYDSMGRLVLSRDAGDHIVETSYTAFGEVGSVTRRYRPTGSPASTTVLPTVTADAARDAVTGYVYDKRGLVVSTTDAEGYTTTSTYDAFGQLASVTRASATTRFEYSKRGLVVKTTDAMLFTENYAYDAFGNRVSVTNKVGGTTLYAYDKRGLLLSEVLPIASYDAGGVALVSSVTGTANIVNSYAYNALGNRIQMVEAAGLAEARTTTYEYDKLGRLTKTKGQARTILNQADHKTETSGFIPTETIAYDAAGNIMSITDAAGGRSVYFYDDLGRKTVEIDATGRYAKYVYDANGNVTEARVYEKKVTVPATDGGPPPVAPTTGTSRATIFTYDNLNRLLTSSVMGVETGYLAGTSWLPSTTAITTAYEYDALGNVVKLIDANGNATFSDYDRLGRKTAQLDTEKYLTTWTYDAEGNVVSETRYANRDNLFFNADLASIAGWDIGYNPNGIASGDPYVVDYRGQLGVKLHVNATTAEQVASVRSAFQHTVPVAAGEKVAIEVGVEASGSVGMLSLTLHFFDANEVYLGGITPTVLYGNQEYGTKISGIVEVPAGAAKVMCELYGFSTGAGTGHFVLIEPALSAISGSQPVASNAADRVTTYSYDKNGNRLTETRNGVAVHDGSGGVLAPQDVTVSWVYNGLGQVVQKNEATDDPLKARGQVGDESTYYSYDVGGRLINEERAAFRSNYNDVVVTPSVDYRYNGLGDLTYTREVGQADSLDRETRYTYGAGGLLATMTDATGVVHSYSYDKLGTLIRDEYRRAGSAGGLGERNAVLTTVDALGRTVLQTVAVWNGSGWAKGDLASTEYNAFGEVSRLDGLRQAENKYDAAGRLWATNAGDGVWKIFGYDKNGNQTVAITSAGENLKNLTFAAARAKVGQADVNATYTVYDKRNMATRVVEEGRQLSATATETLTTRRSYNAFGEVVAEVGATDAVTTYSYNNIGKMVRSEGPAVAITLENGKEIWVKPSQDYYYDKAGRLVATRDGNGAYAETGTGAGNATTKVAHTGNLTRLTLLAGTGYDGGEALVTKQIAADGGERTTKYDTHGDARITIDEAGRWTHREFDRRGLLAVEYHSGGLTDRYAYDSLGQRVRHWNNFLNPGNTTDGLTGEVETTDYDLQGRVVATRAFGGDVTTTAFSWDGAIAAITGVATGGWTTVTTMANGRTLSEKSDVFGRTTWKSDLGGHVTTYAYDIAGRQTGSTMGVVSTTFTYYNTGQLATNSGPNGAATYGYDAGGNRITERLVKDGATIKDQSASYDAMGRLKTWNEAGTTYSPIAFTAHAYDANGNIRKTHTEFRMIDANGGYAPNATIKDYWFAFDSMNRLVVDRGMLSGAAGAAGTTIIRGATGTSIFYDVAGQRVSSETSGVEISLRAWMRTWWGQNTYYHRKEIEDDGARWSDITLTQVGNRRERYEYDSAGRLSAINQQDSEISFVDGASSVGVGSFGAVKPRSIFGYDAMGRMTSQHDYNAAGDTIVFSRKLDYNSKGQLIEDDSSTVKTDSYTYRTITRNDYGVGANYALGSLVQTLSDSYRNGNDGDFTDTATKYTFEWFDSAVQKTIKHDKSYANDDDPNTQGMTQGAMLSGFDDDTSSVSLLNNFGQVQQATIIDGQSRDVYFTLDENGQVIRREETRPTNAPSVQTGAPNEIWYRFGGREMGYSGNNDSAAGTNFEAIGDRLAPSPNPYGTFRGGSAYAISYADFTNSYDAITSFDQGSAGGSYTVRGGDTLASIAQSLYGDASLWYKIAEANGMSGNVALAEGQALTLPSGVVRSTHNAGTFKPYDPADAIGDLSPTTPKPPKKPKCGMFGMILVAAIAIGLSVWLGPQFIGAAQGMLAGGATGGVAAGSAAATAASVAGGIMGGAAAGAVSSAVSQGFAVAAGIQDKFSWKGVGLAAIGGGIGGGISGLGDAANAAVKAGKTLNGFGRFAQSLGGSSVGMSVARGVFTNAATQGIGVATGLQSKFDFAGVAAAGIGAGVSRFVGARTASLDSFGSDLISNTAAGIANAATRSAINGNSFGDNLRAAIPDIIGQTIGSALARTVAGADPKGGAASRSSLERAEGMSRAIIGDEEASEYQIERTRQYALELDETREIKDPEQKKLALNGAMRRFISDIPETDRQIAVTDRFFEDVYGTPSLSPQALERGGLVVTGNPESLPYWGGRLVDNSGIWLGEKEAAIAGAVQGFVKEHPTAGVAMQVVATGYDVLGGPVKWAGSKALELFKGRVTSWVEGGYTEAGWGSPDATNGAKGVVLGAGLVLGGGLKKLLGGRPTAERVASPALNGDPYHPASVAARVRPEYRSNPAHDTRSPLFNPNKTPEPADAASVYTSAQRTGMGSWIGSAADGRIYQFFSDNAGSVHFSGVLSPAQAAKKGFRE